MDLHLSISNGFVSSKIYIKQDDFDFDIYIVIFLFFDDDVLCRPSYGVYNSQLISFFSRVCSQLFLCVSLLLCQFLYWFRLLCV